MAAKTTNEEKIWLKMTIREKVSYVVQNITVEPLMAFYILPSVFLRLAVQNLTLEKACRVNLNYSEEVCDALTIRNTTYVKLEETRVQATVAEMTVWMSFLNSVIPAILIMFLGSWSDRRRKRKLCMLMPFVGELCSALGLILCVYHFHQLSMEVTGFVQSFFPAITGGWVTMFMGTFSYLAEITNAETRTFRIGAVNIFCSASTPFAMAVSGISIKKLGFYGVFLMAIVGFTLGFVYGFYRIKENKAPYSNVNDMGEKEPLHRNTSSTFQSKYCMDTVKEFLNDFFKPQNVLDTFGLLFKRKSGTNTKRILVLMIVLVLVLGPMHGEMTVLYLFMRYRFNWDEVQFSIFSTYSVVTHLIGTSFSVGVFSHLLKIDDALIGVMSCISKILAGFVYAFARTEWQVYLAPLVDIVNGTSFIAMRSIASKLVPPEELGKLNSLYGACEALTPLLYGPMYAFVYSHTMDTMPGAFFLLGGALTMPAVVIFGWMYTQHRGDRLQKATSRKSSMADDVIRNLRVESLAVTPSFQTSDTDPAPHAEGHGGEVNMAFEDSKT